MSDNSDNESVDREPTEQELTYNPPSLVNTVDGSGFGWEASILDYDRFGDMNEEGFLSLETISGSKFIVNKNKLTGVSSIK